MRCWIAESVLVKVLSKITIIRYLDYTGDCHIVGVHTQTFHRCRAASPTGQYFTMNECSVGQVMSIQSAEAGYSHSYNPSANSPQCSGNDCTRPIQEPITLCDGRRSCRIPQSVLLYPQGDVVALCDLSRDGNFIRIRFTCVTGTIFCVVLSSILHTYRVWMYIKCHDNVKFTHMFSKTVERLGIGYVVTYQYTLLI